MACVRCRCESDTHMLNGQTWQVPFDAASGQCYRCEIMDDELDFMTHIYTDRGPWIAQHTGRAWALYRYEADKLVERAMEVFNDKTVATQRAAWLNYWVHRSIHGNPVENARRADEA